MRKKLFLVIISLIILNKSLYGQANFVEGYLITNDLDTVRGLIDYQQWEKNPGEITAKKDESSEIKKYMPLEIKAFYVGGDFYESQIVSYTRVSNKLNNIQSTSSMSTETDTVFLKLMVRGNINLYLLNDENYQSYFFIQKGSSKVETLVYLRYIDNVDGKKVIRENNLIRNQLIYYLREYPDIQNKVKGLPYRADKLYNLIAFYHDCISEQYVAYSSQEVNKGEFLIITGITKSIINFNGGGGQFHGTKNNNLNNPAFGIAYNSFLRSNKQRFSLYNELLYRSYRVQGAFSEFIEGALYDVDVTFDMQYLQLTNLVRYYLPQGKTTPFFNAEIANGIAIRARSFLVQNHYPTPSEDENIVRNLNVRKYDRDLTIGFGLKDKHISGEFRYQRSRGASNYYLLRSSNHVISTLLSYSF